MSTRTNYFIRINRPTRLTPFQDYACSLKVCHLCLASMGRCANFNCVYTDVTNTAGWRATIGARDPWDFAPALTRLSGFSMRMVASDLLHNWNLGCLRDIVGSVVKLLIRDKHYFDGSNIPKRFRTLSRELRFFAKSNGMQLSLTGVKRDTIVWKSDACPELHSSGHDAMVFLKYLVEKVQQKAPPSYNGLVMMLWAADTFMSCIQHAGPFLEQDEAATVSVVGYMWLTSYIQLANQAQANREYLFKCRPKMHMINHTIDDAIARLSRRNPAQDTTWMDEDYIKSVMRMKRKMDYRTMSTHCLFRFLVVTKQSLLKALKADNGW